MTRIAALHAPLFPLAARLRSEPELHDRMVAVCEGNGAAARIVAVSRAARQAGVRAEMSLAQARSILPDLIALGRDPIGERSTHEALLEVAANLSPRVEDAAEDLVLADVNGMDRLFPGLDGEAEMAHLARQTAAKLGLFIRVGIAGTKLAARIAARRPEPYTVVPLGGETSFLAPLPLHVLDPTPTLERSLRRWGIKTLGDLAVLPAADISRRLGVEGEVAHQAARGEDPEPLIPRHPEPVLTEGMELEWPVTTLEPLLLNIAELIDRLMRRLLLAGAAVALLELELELEPDGIDRRAIRLPSPSTDARALLGILRLDLESKSPEAPVAGVRCIAHPDRPRRAQLTLFGPEEISPSSVAAVLARAAARLGPERVGSPRSADDPTPGLVELVPFNPPPPPRVHPEPRRSRGLLAVRTLRPPVPVEVMVEEEGRGGSEETRQGAHPADSWMRPVSLCSETGADLHIQGLVRVAAGPWRCESGWWRGHPMDRDYWDVELSDGRLYRIFRNRRGGDWYADGVYD